MIIFVVMLNVLILTIALSMDLGRAFMASSAIAGAADAAAVASAVEGGDAAKAQAYFMANLPVGTFSIGYNYNTDVTHTVDTAAGTVAVVPRGFDVPAFFSRGTNVNATVNVGGASTVGLASGSFAPADYYFIIDSSGSMGGSSGSGGSKAQAVGLAINNFLDIIFANQGVGANGISNYRVSLTNYRGQYASSEPLNDDKASLILQLNPMLVPGGTTCGGCGLRDSKERLIEAAVSDNQDRQSIIIFMTDGQLNQTYPYMNPKHPDYAGSFAVGSPHEMAALECDSMKGLVSMMPNGEVFKHQMSSGGVPLQVLFPPTNDPSIWTVRFGSGANGGVNLQLMDYCASDPAQSLYAQTGNDLDQIFSLIGQTTGRIRILQ